VRQGDSSEAQHPGSLLDPAARPLRGLPGAHQGAVSVVELAGGLVGAYAAVRFGPTLAAFAAMVFCWTLIALTVIDLDTPAAPGRHHAAARLGPGLAFNLGATFVPLASAVIGAIAGYLALWSVYWGFKLLTGKEGMGYGDFKLLAAIGAWLGWQMLPLVILLSSIVGAAVGIGLMVFAGHGRDKPIPFGPYLAAGGRDRALLGRRHRRALDAALPVQVSGAFVVGLTGGIGSGKSAAADEFARLGATIVDTDAIAHELTSAGGAAIPLLRGLFGPAYFDASGAMDRAKVRATVFADPLAKKEPRSTAHPMIRAESERRIGASAGALRRLRGAATRSNRAIIASASSALPSSTCPRKSRCNAYDNAAALPRTRSGGSSPARCRALSDAPRRTM
jgi:Flp pilus assembly protein protease CpaA